MFSKFLIPNTDCSADYKIPWFLGKHFVKNGIYSETTQNQLEGENTCYYSELLGKNCTYIEKETQL